MAGQSGRARSSPPEPSSFGTCRAGPVFTAFRLERGAIRDGTPMTLFLVHRFNDLDHIVPIVDRMCRDGKPVLVLTLNPYLSTDDWRMRYLASLEGAKLESVYRVLGSSRIERLVGAVVSAPVMRAWFSKDRIKGLVGALCRRFVLRPLLRWVVPRVFDDRWARELFAQVTPVAVVVDHGARDGVWVFGPIMRAARERQIPTIAVPHGLSLHAGRTAVFDTAYANMLGANFDTVVVPHDVLKDDLIAHGHDADKIVVLGSARYCTDWVERLHDFVPFVLPVAARSSKLNVVYMDRGADRHGRFKDSIEQALSAVAELAFVEFVYKPHTRSNRVLLSWLEARVTIATDADSVNLVRWADVVIGTVSSVLVEVLLQDKTLVYPAFFDDDTMLFDEFGACWRVEDIDELLSALQALHVGKARPYGSKALKRFHEMAICGGVADRDVLGEYVDLILEHTNRFDPRARRLVSPGQGEMS